MRAEQVLIDSPHFRVLDTLCSHPRAGCGGVQSGYPAQFILTRRGSFGLHVGARSYLAHPGTAVLLCSEIEFLVTHPARLGHDHCTNICIDVALFGEIVHETECVSTTAGRELCHGLDFHEAHLKSMLALSRHGAATLDVEEVLLELLTWLLRIRSETAIRRAHPARVREQVERVQAAILARIDENLGVDELAKVAGCSPYHLCRMFRAVTGQSLRHFRLQQRLGTALSRLSEGEEDLAALACDLGFSSHSHMCEAFRQALGSSPHALRDAMRNADLGSTRVWLRALTTSTGPSSPHDNGARRAAAVHSQRRRAQKFGFSDAAS